MRPVLSPGRIYILNKAAYGLYSPFKEEYFYTWAKPKNGDIIAFIDPIWNKYTVKRCVGPVVSENKNEMDKLYNVSGDNNFDSIDSRTYGPVRIEKIVGKILLFTRHE
jgi:signal peptidase I